MTTADFYDKLTPYYHLIYPVAPRLLDHEEALHADLAVGGKGTEIGIFPRSGRCGKGH